MKKKQKAEKYVAGLLTNYMKGRWIQCKGTLYGPVVKAWMGIALQHGVEQLVLWVKIKTDTRRKSNMYFLPDEKIEVL